MGLGGGSILLLYLSFCTDMPQPQMQAANLMLFLPCALLALFLHRKNGLLDKRSVKKFLPWAIAGGILGSIGGNALRPDLLRQGFGILLLFMGSRQLISILKERKK